MYMQVAPAIHSPGGKCLQSKEHIVWAHLLAWIWHWKYICFKLVAPLVPITTTGWSLPSTDFPILSMNLTTLLLSLASCLYQSTMSAYRCYREKETHAQTMNKYKHMINTIIFMITCSDTTQYFFYVYLEVHWFLPQIMGCDLQPGKYSIYKYLIVYVHVV